MRNILASSEIIELENFNIPDCYGYFSGCDCILSEACLQTLLEKLPDCFGLLYDQNECSGCMVREECQEPETEVSTETEWEVYFETNLLKILSRYRKTYRAWPLESSCNLRRASVRRLNTLDGTIYLKAQKNLVQTVTVRLPINDIERSPVHGVVSN